MKTNLKLEAQGLSDPLKGDQRPPPAAGFKAANYGLSGSHPLGGLGRAEEQAAALRSNGYLVEQTETGNVDVGVIRDYQRCEQDGTAIARAG